jgi:hypothetical protein
MKIERGAEQNGLRLSVIIQSLDVDTHSKMCDTAEDFSRLLDELCATTRNYVAEVFPSKELRDAREKEQEK